MAKAFIFGAIAALCLIQGVMCAFPDPTIFFKDNMTDGEISRLVWRHRANEEDKFMEALKNASINLLEVDVIKEATSGAGPLIHHDINGTSTFTLKKLLEHLKASQTKGIKFDFKELKALQESIPLIQGEKLTVPVFINADIAQGPGGAAEVVDLSASINDISTNLGGSILSAGWTTGNANTSYTADQIGKMKAAVNKFAVLITYPVRASLVQHTNTSVFDPLLNGTKSTLTIWTVDKEDFNVDAVKTFVEAIGRKRVYLDLPEDIQQKINGSASIAINSVMILGAIFSYFMMMF